MAQKDPDPLNTVSRLSALNGFQRASLQWQDCSLVWFIDAWDKLYRVMIKKSFKVWGLTVKIDGREDTLIIIINQGKLQWCWYIGNILVSEFRLCLQLNLIVARYFTVPSIGMAFNVYIWIMSVLFLCCVKLHTNPCTWYVLQADTLVAFDSSILVHFVLACMPANIRQQKRH